MAESFRSIHPTPTRRRGLRYGFYIKHHTPGNVAEAQWVPPPALTEDAEFDVFDLADFFELEDGKGNLFGLRARDESGRIPELGARAEQIAKFPFARRGEIWHGYPYWPITNPDPGHARPQPVPKGILEKMVFTGLLTEGERRKLSRGKVI